jgi:tRNA pseudouridine55 synthase
MLGEATKLSEYLTAAHKSYRAELTFGRSTDTFDCLGTTTSSGPPSEFELSLPRIERALHLERSRSLQVPPAFSAIKQGGETAYKKARRGEVVTLPPRSVFVEHLTLDFVAHDRLGLSMTVSKGYYVRSLVRDLCAELGVPGCLTALCRTASGCFALENAVPWPPQGDSTPTLIPLKDAVRTSLPTATLTRDGVLRARQGKLLGPNEFDVCPTDSPSVWLDGEGEPVAIGETIQVEGNVAHKVVRGFVPPPHVTSVQLR